MRRYGLRLVALGYLTVVLLAPVAMVFWRAFDNGAAHLWDTLSDPNTVHAFVLTAEITAIAREAGHRSKISVRSTQPGVNAKGLAPWQLRRVVAHLDAHLPQRVDPAAARATLNLGVLVVTAPMSETGSGEARPSIRET